MSTPSPQRRRLAASCRLVLLMVAVAFGASAAPAGALDAISISGNHFVAGGQTVRLIGVNRSGSEYACASSDDPVHPGFGIFQGPVDDQAVDALVSWHVNAVAIPLNEACWLGGYANMQPGYSGASYRNAIVAFVNRLNAKGIYAVIRLAGAAPGDHAFLEPGQTDSHELAMADADHSLTFWTSVATTFKDNHGVVFHAYDEPNSDDVTWACLRDGCQVTDRHFDGTPRFGTYQTVGHQAIVNAIRAAGATQPILLAGIGFAGTFDHWLDFLPTDPQNQLAADVSAFDYADLVFYDIQDDLATISATHPVLFGGFGDTDCNSDFSEKVMGFADEHGMSYLAWTWNTAQDYGGCSNALLDDDGPAVGGQPAGYFSAKPSGFGRGVRDHFACVRTAAPCFLAVEPQRSALTHVPYTASLHAAGTPAPTYTVSTGTLPPGLTLSGDGNVSGTPTAAGRFTFRVTAHNGAGADAVTEPITIEISDAGPGTVLGFGDNSEGQLGNGTAVTALTPTPVAFPAAAAPIIQASAGNDHAVALASDGQLWSWGNNALGALGTGPTDTAHSSRTPVAVVFPGAVPQITAVSAGYKFTLALDDAGHVWAWGDNAVGELGTGSASTAVGTPAKVALGAADGHVVAIAAGGDFGLALTDTHTVLAWGGNSDGQLGTGDTTPHNTPVAVSLGAASGHVTAISAGDVGGNAGHALALTDAGTVLAWGSNDEGMLGDGTTAGRSTPVTVHGVGGSGELNGVVTIAAAGLHSLAGRADGSVVAWGHNDVGELGDSSTANRAVPVAVQPAPGSGDLPSVAALAGGWFHSLALTSGGRLLAWGGGLVNALGIGVADDRHTPDAVLLPSAETKIGQISGRARYSLAVVAGVSTATLPSVLSGPTLTGTPQVGQTLTCSRADWSGSQPQSYIVSWLRDDQPIDGATTREYTPLATDAGHSIACREGASNSAGGAAATSAPVTVAGSETTPQPPVSQEPASPPPGPSGGALRPGDRSPMTRCVAGSVRLLKDLAHARFALQCTGAATVKVSGTLKPKGRGTVKVDAVRLSVAGGARTTISFRLPRSVRGALRSRRTVKLVFTVTVTVPGQAAARLPVTATLKRREGSPV